MSAGEGKPGAGGWDWSAGGRRAPQFVRARISVFVAAVTKALSSRASGVWPFGLIAIGTVFGCHPAEAALWSDPMRTSISFAALGFALLAGAPAANASDQRPTELSLMKQPNA
jgi:hypothetical protein